MKSRLTLTEAVAIKTQIGIHEIRENIIILDVKATQHQKLLLVSPTKPYLNSKGVTLDLYQDFRRIFWRQMHLWPNNEIRQRFKS